jgi:hypothetical protein
VALPKASLLNQVRQVNLTDLHDEFILLLTAATGFDYAIASGELAVVVVRPPDRYIRAALGSTAAIAKKTTAGLGCHIWHHTFGKCLNHSIKQSQFTQRTIDQREKSCVQQRHRFSSMG